VIKPRRGRTGREQACSVTGVTVHAVALDRSAVPEPLRALVRLAERWGIGDDYDRSLAVENASPDERQVLIEAAAAAPKALWTWLERGPQTPEWAAFTCMTQAADEARVVAG